MPATEPKTAATQGSDDKPAAPTDMSKGVQTIVSSDDMPEYPTLLHTIVTRDANHAIEFYRKTLRAEVKFRYHEASGKVMHAVLKTAYGLCIGVEDYFPQFHMVKPAEKGGVGMGCSYVYVSLPDGFKADEEVERMREGGGVVMGECVDMFYGQRLGKVVDEFGVAWCFAHSIEKKAEC